LKRDLGNAFVRDLLSRGDGERNPRTGCGLVVQLAVKAKPSHRSLDRRANHQVRRRDAGRRQEVHQAHPARGTSPRDRPFLELFTRPAVMDALKKFVEDSGPMPYLP